jgi:tetratricopeptide (TPR) repeat protein
VLTTYFDRRAHWQDRATTHHTAVAAARDLADRDAEADAHRGLAFAQAELGRYDDAHTNRRQALDLFGSLGDHRGRARTHLALSWTFDRQSRPAEALRHAEEALALHQAGGDRNDEAGVLIHLGDTHAATGENTLANEAWQRALAILVELNHPGAGAIRAKLLPSRT